MYMAVPSLNFAKEATREQRSKHYSLVQPCLEYAKPWVPTPDQKNTKQTTQEKREDTVRRAEERKEEEERGRGEQEKRKKDSRVRKENFMAPCKMKPHVSIAD